MPYAGDGHHIKFPTDLTNFRHGPFLFNGRAHLALGGQLLAVDISTKTTVWQWPKKNDINDPSVGSNGELGSIP